MKRNPVDLDSDQVRWVAHLARLDIDDAELALFTRQLSAILDYVSQLKEVVTDDVQPLAHPVPLQDVFRNDELVESLPVEIALGNAPDRRGDFYGVPAVLE